MSSSNCSFLTCIQVSQEAGQVVWYSHLLQNFPRFIVIHTIKGFGIVNKAEIDVFLELSCFFDDPADVGNLIAVSSAFSKTSLNIWKFMVHVLLKPGLENFEHYFTNVWDECNCAAREFQKNIYFCFTDYAKVFVWITTNWKILKEMGIPDHLTCLLRNLYAGQEAMVRTRHRQWTGLKTGKGVCWGWIYSPCLFNLYAEYIIWNARLDESQAGIKTSANAHGLSCSEVYKKFSILLISTQDALETKEIPMEYSIIKNIFKLMS